MGGHFEHLLFRAAYYLVGLALVVAGRGMGVAHISGGSYVAHRFIRELFGLSALLIICHSVYWIFGKLLSLFFNRTSCALRWGENSLRFIFTLLVIFPFLLVSIQMHPQRIVWSTTPADLGIEYSTVQVPGEVGALSTWLMMQKDPRAPIALVVHGLTASKANFLPLGAEIYKLGYSVVMFDFRGHGDSEGWAFSFGYAESGDVKSVCEWVHTKFPENRISAIAYSAGAFATLKSVSEGLHFDKVVLDSGYYRLENVVKKSVLAPLGPLSGVVWRVGCPWGALWSKGGLCNADLLSGSPISFPSKPLLIHGKEDKLIPPSETESLLSKLNDHANIWLVEGLGHLETPQHPEYWGRVGRFLKNETE